MMKHLAHIFDVDPMVMKVVTLMSAASSGSAAVAAVDMTMGVFGVPMYVFLAGFAGALVSLSFLPPPVVVDSNARLLASMAWHVLCGTLMSAYLTPAAMAALTRYVALGLPPEIALGVAFALGMLLMVAIPMAIKYVKKLAGQT